MTRFLVSTLVVGTAGAVLAQTPQSPAFHGGTHTVSVYATVSDRVGRSIPDLNQTDFDVFDNGVRQPITIFRSDLQPITIVVMLDRSGSMLSNFELVKTAAAQFITQLQPDDRARVGSFSNRIEIDPPTFTGNKQTLMEVLQHKLQPIGATPLWNATALAMDALGHEDGRRVVLMFTDGKDNPVLEGPTTRLEEVIAQSQRDEVMVYAIGLSTPCDSALPPANFNLFRSIGQAPFFQRRPGGGGGGQGGRPGGRGGPGGIGIPGSPGGRIPGRPPLPLPMPPDVFGRGRSGGDGRGGARDPWQPAKPCVAEQPDRGLREVADESGGNYFELRGTDNLGETFARVADELHRQYLLAFSATQLDGTVHRLEVRVNKPGVIVRARKTYIASAGR